MPTNESWFQKSAGHLAWFYDKELINVNGALFKAPRTNEFDPDGYRYGMQSDIWTRSVTPEQALQELEEFDKNHPEYKAFRLSGAEKDAPPTKSRR